MSASVQVYNIMYVIVRMAYQLTLVKYSFYTDHPFEK